MVATGTRPTRSPLDPTPSAPTSNPPSNDRIAALVSERAIDGPVKDLTTAV
jgi:hypothetical protein